MKTAKVDIRPGVSILSVLKHLNYRPWFAMAEFVDNSLQSYQSNRDKLNLTHQDEYQLKVEIEFDTTENGSLVIRDNAAGISECEYPRAFRPAAIPTDRSGLSEFGMGMKAASCWFAPCWTVKTSALGEPVEGEITFDIGKIVEDNIQELSINLTSSKPEHHFTEITLRNLHKPPHGRTIGKIKEHLASIYRVFLRNGDLLLTFDGEQLIYTTPHVLISPYYKTPTADAQEWSKKIDFDFGQGMRAKGFAALREVASLSQAGFALFRRGRLIQGSADEGYRPEAIFGKSNSFTYQRLFGELELEGFEVSHTKDGFRWDENEEPFLQLLEEALDSDELCLLKQAEGYRVRSKPNPDILKKGAETASRRTADTIEYEVPPVLSHEFRETPDISDLPKSLPKKSSLASTQERFIELDGETWKIALELSDDPGVTDWLTVSDTRSHAGGGPSQLRQVYIRISLVHPFMEQFGGSDADSIEPIIRIGVALGLSEIVARQTGDKMGGTIRRCVNNLLRNALSKP